MKEASLKKNNTAKKAIIASVAILLVAAIVAASVFVYFVFLQHRYNVKHPISKEDSELITKTVKDAQYLPNLQILALKSNNLSSCSRQLQNDFVIYEKDEAYDMYSLTDNNELDFEIDEYRMLNNSLANITGSTTMSEQDIESLKEEILVALEIVPGYDQWYMFFDNVPHVSNPDLYFWNSYKLNYDKDTGHITMSRLSWKRCSTMYDLEKGVCYDDTDYSYSRQLLQVDYYTNEDGREVVDCSVITFQMTNGIYYPALHDRIINIEDYSTTKISNTYIRGQYYTYDPTLDSYCVQDARKNAVFTNVVQLNYGDDDNIRMLKLNYITSDLNLKIPTMTEVTYYDKSPSQAYYYTSSWDNSYSDNINDMDSNNSIPYQTGVYHIDANTYFCVHTVQEEYLMRNFSQQNVSIVYPCADCTKNKRTKDGVFIYCDHGPYADQPVRMQNQIFSDNPAIFTDIDIVYSAISDQVQLACDSLDCKTDFHYKNENKLDFETALTDFIGQLGGICYEKFVERWDFASEEQECEKTYSTIRTEQMNEVLASKYTYLTNIQQLHSNLNDTTISYCISANVTGQNDPDTNYYIAVLAELYMNSQNYVILEKTAVVPGTDTIWNFEGTLELSLIHI